jgi:hypothetical protein
MIARRIERWLRVGCYSAALFILLVWARYAIPTARAVRDGAVSGKGLVKELQRAAQRSVQSSDKITEVLTDMDADVKDAGPILWKFDDVADAAKDSMKQAGEVAGTINVKIAALDVTADQAKALATLDTITGAVPHITGAVDNAAELEDTANTLIAGPATGIITDSRTFLNGPLTFAVNKAGELEATTELTEDQARKRWVAPWDHTHPWKHYGGIAAEVGISLAGAGATLAK